MKYICCLDCKQEISKNNIKKHLNSKGCERNKRRLSNNFIVLNDGYCKCLECSKIFTENGIYPHIWRNHGDGKEHNPNKGYEIGSRLGTNGFIKGTQLTHSADTRMKIGLKNIGFKQSDELKLRRSITRKQLFLDGKISGWNRIYHYKRNETIGSKPAIVYVGIFSIGDIEFIKIGITERSFLERYSAIQYRKFKIREIKTFLSTNVESAIIENKILDILKPLYHYKFPDNIDKFDGYSECLKIDALDIIINEFDKWCKEVGAGSRI